jgi:hypothetical protein
MELEEKIPVFRPPLELRTRVTTFFRQVEVIFSRRDLLQKIRPFATYRQILISSLPRAAMKNLSRSPGRPSIAA